MCLNWEIFRHQIRHCSDRPQWVAYPTASSASCVLIPLCMITPDTTLFLGKSRQVRDFSVFSGACLSYNPALRNRKICSTPGHGPSPATVFNCLPTVLPLSPDGFSRGATAHLRTSFMEVHISASVHISAARYPILRADTLLPGTLKNT